MGDWKKTEWNRGKNKGNKTITHSAQEDLNFYFSFSGGGAVVHRWLVEYSADDEVIAVHSSDTFKSELNRGEIDFNLGHAGRVDQVPAGVDVLGADPEQWRHSEENADWENEVRVGG